MVAAVDRYSIIGVAHAARRAHTALFCFRDEAVGGCVARDAVKRQTARAGGIGGVG